MKDGRGLPETLRPELDFVGQGGCGRAVREPHVPASIFRDSPDCPNFGYPYRVQPRREGLPDDFMPEARRRAVAPRHHIPLDADGQTVGGRS